jgi:hypothetical protein
MDIEPAIPGQVDTDAALWNTFEDLDPEAIHLMELQLTQLV